MTEEEQYFDRLRQRRDWLTARIAAKESVGWDVEYDTAERDALAWALAQLGGPVVISAPSPGARRT